MRDEDIVIDPKMPRADPWTQQDDAEAMGIASEMIPAVWHGKLAEEALGLAGPVSDMGKVLRLFGLKRK